MPRPKVEDDRRRRREVAILLNGPESRAVRDAAKRRAMRVSAFVRQAAIAAAADAIPADRDERHQLQPDPGAVALRREVRRLGSNLNQAVRLAHQGRDPDLQSAVDELLAVFREVLTR